MELCIRLATAADLPAIVAIYNAAIPGRMATADLVPVTVASRQSWFADRDMQHYPIWVAVVDGQPWGWLSLQMFYGRMAYRQTAEVSVYIAPARQRCGVGKALLAHAIATGPTLGLRTLLGLIFSHNLPSLRLFQGMGFEPWGLLPGIADMDGRDRDLAILGLQLFSRGRAN